MSYLLRIVFKSSSDLFSKIFLLSILFIIESLFTLRKNIQSIFWLDLFNKLIENIIFDPQKKNKLIFDGYPRSLNQAKNLDLLLVSSNQKIDFIFFLNVNKDTIIKRIERRKILEKRSDDDSNTILKRYDTYMETTRPVLDFYSSRSYFYEIDGSEKIEVISGKIEQIITL